MVSASGAQPAEVSSRWAVQREPCYNQGHIRQCLPSEWVTFITEPRPVSRDKPADRSSSSVKRLFVRPRSTLREIDATEVCVLTGYHFRTVPCDRAFLLTLRTVPWDRARLLMTRLLIKLRPPRKRLMLTFALKKRVVPANHAVFYGGCFTVSGCWRAAGRPRTVYGRCQGTWRARSGSDRFHGLP
ncbi:hypothetical protein Bbelb_300500 [Branchiostoma belcheri]|nr:hypothetical protein Bbelb_300500 [Branchiostoma belcheri]